MEKQGKPGSGAICLLLEENVLQCHVPLPALRIVRVTSCMIGKLQLG